MKQAMFLTIIVKVAVLLFISGIENKSVGIFEVSDSILYKTAEHRDYHSGYTIAYINTIGNPVYADSKYFTVATDTILYPLSDLREGIETPVKVILPDTLRGLVGEKVWFHLSLDDISGRGLNGFSFRAEHNSEIVEIGREGIYRGDLVTGLFESNVTRTGVVRVMAASANDFDGTGSLLSIEVKLLKPGIFKDAFWITDIVLGETNMEININLPISIVVFAE